MIDTKCGYCGTIPQAAEANCLVCGGDLSLRPFGRDDPGHDWQPRIDPNQPIPGIPAFGIDTGISESVSVFFKNFWQITKIVVVVVTPFQIVAALNATAISTQWELTTWTVLLGAACKVLVAPPLIYSLLKAIQTGTPAGIQESYRWGLSKFVKLAICALITAVLTGLGYVLCIIPGIIVSLSLAVVYPVAVLEERSVSDVLRRSSDLTRGHRMEIFVVYLVVGIVMAIAAGICGLAIGMINWVPVTIIGSIASDVFEQLFTVLSLVLYLSLSQGFAEPLSTSNSVLSLNE